MSSRRGTKKSGKQLEEEEIFLSEKLSHLCLTNLETVDTAEDLKQISDNLKSTFNLYNNVILDLVEFCRKNGAIEEEKSYISDLGTIRERYKKLIRIVSDKRYSKGDDNVTIISSSYADSVTLEKSVLESIKP